MRPSSNICGYLREKLRFEFQAEDAVYTGVLTPQQYSGLSGKYLTLTAFRQFHCVRESIIETTADCNVGISNAVLAVRDKRGPITRAMGAYSTVRPVGGSAALADRASKPNKVKVTLYQWACVEDCPNWFRKIKLKRFHMLPLGGTRKNCNSSNR
jgi:hypothetical protein